MRINGQLIMYSSSRLEKEGILLLYVWQNFKGRMAEQTLIDWSSYLAYNFGAWNVLDHSWVIIIE